MASYQTKEAEEDEDETEQAVSVKPAKEEPTQDPHYWEKLLGSHHNQDNILAKSVFASRPNYRTKCRRHRFTMMTLVAMVFTITLIFGAQRVFSRETPLWGRSFLPENTLFGFILFVTLLLLLFVLLCL